MALRSLLEAAPPKASGAAALSPGNKLEDGACAPAPGGGETEPPHRPAGLAMSRAGLGLLPGSRPPPGSSPCAPSPRLPCPHRPGAARSGTAAGAGLAGGRARPPRGPRGLSPVRSLDPACPVPVTVPGAGGPRRGQCPLTPRRLAAQETSP